MNITRLHHNVCVEMLVWNVMNVQYVGTADRRLSFGQSADNLATALDVEPQGQGFFAHGVRTEAPLGADSFYRLATSVLCLLA